MSLMESGIFMAFEKLLEAFLDGLSNAKPLLSLDEINSVFSNSIDNIILREEETSGTKFIGGEFNIEYADDKNYVCGYALYFQNVKDKDDIDEMSAKSKKYSSQYLSKEARAELKAKKIVKYDVTEPTPQARARYERMKQTAK